MDGLTGHNHHTIQLLSSPFPLPPYFSENRSSLIPASVHRASQTNFFNQLIATFAPWTNMNNANPIPHSEAVTTATIINAPTDVHSMNKKRFPRTGP